MLNTLDGDGIVNLGHNAHITYFAQDQAEALDPSKTIYETVDDVAKGDIRRDLRSVLGAFLFTGEDVDKKVGVLSGGERTRLALCQLLLSPSNFLILDEPTNHLDIQSKEVLKEALKNYEGTFIVVSHDREFLDGLTNRIWDIENKTLKIHHFGVHEFLKRKVEMGQEISTAKKVASQKMESIHNPENKTSDSLSFEEAKDLKRRKNQLNNQVKRTEEAIGDLEAKLAEMDLLIADLDYSNEQAAVKLLDDYHQLKMALDAKMSEWEAATEELMELES
jgi:ATP-binding cassette subfamily F protein 3